MKHLFPFSLDPFVRLVKTSGRCEARWMPLNINLLPLRAILGCGEGVSMKTTCSKLSRNMVEM